MFPNDDWVPTDENQELIELVEGMMIELAYCREELAKLGGKLSGANRATIEKIIFALDSATNLASEYYAINSEYFSDGFPWNYDRAEYEAYFAKRNEQAGGN